jgi:hypothetical protein
MREELRMSSTTGGCGVRYCLPFSGRGDIKHGADVFASLKPSQDSHFSHVQRFRVLDLLGPTLGPQILHVSGCPAELR